MLISYSVVKTGEKREPMTMSKVELEFDGGVRHTHKN